MTILTVENFLSNLSFLALLFSMIFYWTQVSFSFKTANFGTFGMTLSNLCLLSLLILRWKESGHFPLSNLYESLLFLSWSLTLIHLILEKLTQQKLLACITSPSALFTNAFATFSLPIEMQESSPLVPALQSNWLMMHVTVMILSYAALICGSLLSIAFLMVSSNIPDSGSLIKSFPFVKQSEAFSLFPQKDFSISYNNNQNIEKTNQILELSTLNQRIKVNPDFQNISSSTLNNKEKLAISLDNLSYRILGLGFPFLTIGILSGAVWANEAWGSYWSWDPKETWALLTWLVFAIYLHMRLTKGWTGKGPAIIASLGFIVLWLCFLGVNLIGEGLHSYGWIKS
jgi:cytochrome c-type biogenesis protein CcsB